jgi:hypothetical protein
VKIVLGQAAHQPVATDVLRQRLDNGGLAEPVNPANSRENRLSRKTKTLAISNT